MADSGDTSGPVDRGVLKPQVENFRDDPGDWTVWLVNSFSSKEGWRLDGKMNNGRKWPPGRFTIPASEFAPEVIFWLMSLHIDVPGADPVAIYHQLEERPALN